MHVPFLRRAFASERRGRLLDSRREFGEGAIGCSPHLLRESRDVPRVRCQRARAIAAQVLRLHEHGDRFVGQHVQSMPALGELPGVRPGAPRHRLARACRQKARIARHQLDALLVRPLLECLTVANRDAAEESRDVDRQRRRSVHPCEPEEFCRIALERTAELDGRAIDAQGVTECLAQMAEGLAERSPRLLLRGITPEQRRELIPPVWPWLECQKRDQSECLRAERGRYGNSIG